MLAVKKTQFLTNSTSRWPRALTIRREDFNRDLIGKIIVVFVFLGPILVPVLWLSGIPLLQGIADFGWAFGKSFCTYTDHSFTVGGVPMMVCSRCFGVACGLLAMGLLYHYSPWIRPRLPKTRYRMALLIGMLFIPWLIDSDIERLGLWHWQTNDWIMVPTGFLGGIALILVPLLFWPNEAEYLSNEDDLVNLATTSN